MAVNDDEVKIELPTSVKSDSKNALWVCIKDGEKYKFVSALGTAAFGWVYEQRNTIDGVLKENATALTVKYGVERGAVRLIDGDYSMALTSEEWNDSKEPKFNRSENKIENNVLTSGNKQDEKWSTDWYLEPVDNADVAFDRTMPAGHHWGTLYLPYAVEVPENLTAYYATATAVDVANKVIELTEVENVIPAYTAVLINRADDGATETFSFNYTTEKGNTVTGDVFEGRIMETYVGDANYNYYLLLNASKGEAFYWVAKEYNQTGAVGNTHIRCEANKGFLALSAGTTNTGALSFRFGEDATEIDGVKGEDGEVKTIYDLQGRKVVNPKKGLYIIDGKKVLVK